MKVYHETFGTGKVLASTERLDESGSIVAGDVMFEHGIELDLPLFEVTYSAKKAAAGEDIGKPGKEFKKIAAKAAAKYGSKAAGGRVAGAVLKKLRNEEVEDLDEGQKKSSFGAGTISVGYRGKKYKSEFKAHKAAVRAVKKGSEDPNIYQYGSRNEDAEQIDEKQDAEKAHHDALWSKFREIHGPLPGGRGAQDKYNQKWTAYKAANPMKEDAEQIDEKLVGNQDKIDANKNGKIDAEDFKKLRGKKDKDKKTDYEDEAEDDDDNNDGDVNESVEIVVESNQRVTPDTAAVRMPVVENVVRSILSQGRNLRQEAKIAEFKSRN